MCVAASTPCATPMTRYEDEIAAWLHFERDRLPWSWIEPPSSVLSHASAAALRRLGTIIPASSRW